MAFLDKLNDLAKNAGTIAKGVGDKAGDAVELSKLTAKAASEKGAAADAVKKIGEYYYKKFLEGGEIDEAVAEFFNEAKAHFDAVADLQTQIDALKGAIKAPIETQTAEAEEAPAQAEPVPEDAIEEIEL